MRWTDEQLDDLRRRGDPLADDLLARLADLSEGGVGEMVVHLAHTVGPAGAASGAAASRAAASRAAASGGAGSNGFRSPEAALIADFVLSADRRPDWADSALVERGHRVFREHGLLIGMMLYCASLPEAYASAKGAKALWLTGTLVTQTDRRINETAQFLLDTLEPEGLANDRGPEAIRRVRLMHAAVRRFILHDPRIAQVVDDGATGSCWSSTWGTPINQEELLGTLLTFTLIVFDALARLGVVLSADDMEAYLHLWCVIGWMLGIAPEVLPFDLASARELEPMIRRRLQSTGPAGPADPEGPALETALLDATSARLPRPFRAVPRWLTRHCASPEALAVLGVGTPVGAGGLTMLTRVQRRVVPVRRLTAWTSTALLLSLVRAGRGDRPPFQLPAALGEAWGVDARSPFGTMRRAVRGARPGTATSR